jgi:RimJ/RimL family protein N-acetyltransferase
VNEFSTARLRAEKLREDHFAELRVLHTNAEAMAPLSGVLSEEISRSALTADLEQWQQHGCGRWMFYSLDDNCFVGRCGLSHTTIEGKEQFEIIYAILPEFWGTGLTVEMTVAVANWTFAQKPDLKSISATVKPVNLRSRRVLEKSGFVLDRTVQYYDAPHLLFHLATRNP